MIRRVFRKMEVGRIGAFSGAFESMKKGRRCSVRLTWDVFVRDLNRQARDSFPLVTCGFLQRRTKGRPSGRLHSDAQVSQQETPKTMHLRIGTP